MQPLVLEEKMLLGARSFLFFHSFNELLMPPPSPDPSEAHVAECLLNKMRQRSRAMGREGLRRTSPSCRSFWEAISARLGPQAYPPPNFFVVLGPARRFPLPCSVEELDACFIVNQE
jgi:hypothetical protein